MTHRLRYNLIDVFTDTPLKGNPLAVFTNGRGVPDATMQSIAREMNLSETVFLLPPEQGGDAKLRIFTPRLELPFAGHPVLGAAWILGQPLQRELLVLETGMGNIPITLQHQGDRLFQAHMSQPLPAFSEEPEGVAVLRALGLPEHRSPELLGPVCATNGPNHVLVEVPNEQTLQALSVNFEALARCTDKGVLVFAQTMRDCCCRYFAPAGGVNEDPATGSANGPLGYLLYRAGRLKEGEELAVRQGEAMGRPSCLIVRILTDQGDVEIHVGGSAIVIGRGELVVP